MKALHLKNIRKAFGEIEAVHDVSFTVERGETLAILGPSGCGKSTILRSIAGLESVSGGEVWLNEENATLWPPERRKLGMVFQDYALFPHLTVLQNVAFGPEMRGASKADAAQKAREALERVRLLPLEKRHPHELSGGQQQRVALARALATGSELLLLDEPLSNLDEQLRAELRSELRELLAHSGAAAVMVTHDQREAAAIADRVLLMRAGVVAQEGPVAEVFSSPNSAWVAWFLGMRNIFSRGTEALIVPESAIELHTGEFWPIREQQAMDSACLVTVDWQDGPLQLLLSAREATDLGDKLQLHVNEAKTLRLPEDRT